jgi:uncharacterized membrane protein YhhN
LLARIINPGVSWPVALLCNLAGAIVLVLLALDPTGNLGLAVVLLIPMTITLYGTALMRWLASRDPNQEK